MITDIHSHILPAFDDGAADVETAIKMLTRSAEQGVKRVVSTSHCYPCSSADVESFKEKREKAYNKLTAEAASRAVTLPEIRLGCEVHLTCDLTKFRNIHDLCISGTDYMLLEMPSSKWSDNTVDNVYKLSISGIKPIIAHAERNLSQSEELLSALYMLDVLIQVNAESFGMPQFKKFIDRMFKNKLLHLIGSDMHNMGNRAPCMDKALKYITKRYGSECLEYIMKNADIVLSGEELSYRDLKSYGKRSLFGR